MFLLIPVRQAVMNKNTRFTFHNVSINTEITQSKLIALNTLHSTMFLLIPKTNHRSWSSSSTLHSTMFLLIPDLQKQLNASVKSFTFHNVSINTFRRPVLTCCCFDFTFHNVSINTGSVLGELEAGMGLYIPQCFY